MPRCRWQSGAAGFPGLGLIGSQQNLWLTEAADGSLVVKIWDVEVGAVTIVPVYRQTSVWARFASAHGVRN